MSPKSNGLSLTAALLGVLVLSSCGAPRPAAPEEPVAPEQPMESAGPEAKAPSSSPESPPARNEASRTEKSDDLKALERSIKPDAATMAAAQASGQKPVPKSERKPAPPKADPAPKPAPPKADPAPKPETKPLPPLTDAEKATLLAELESTIKTFVGALDAEDEESLQKLMVNAEFLKETISPGNYTILVGNLIPKNTQVLKSLLPFAKARDVKIVKWTPGRISRTVAGKSIFTKQFPLVAGSTLEISLDDDLLELGIRQAVKHKGSWLVFEVTVKS